jgi:hypothetical protein
MQLAIDGQVEERQITRFLSKLKSYSDSPDISDSERGFLTDKLSLVPRLMAVSSNSVHGSSSTLREDKGGSVTMAGGLYPTLCSHSRTFMCALPISEANDLKPMSDAELVE